MKNEVVYSTVAGEKIPYTKEAVLRMFSDQVERFKKTLSLSDKKKVESWFKAQQHE